MIRRPLWPVFLCSSALRHLEGYLAGILLCCSACQAHRGGPPVWGPTLRSAHQALKGAPWVESYSVVQCGRHLMGQPLYCSTNNAGVWGERETMVMAPPLPWDSAVLPCFHGCLAFLHRHFPLQCPPSHPLDPSLCSQQQPSPWDYSTIPELQLPAAAPSREPASLSWVCMAVARTV